MEVDQARRANQQVAASLRRIGNEATQAGKSTSSAMGSLSTAARGAGQAVAAIGTVTAAGMAAATVSILKGGIAYNTLEQTSRAALTTLTGSAAAATAQMDQLREFGKTSPFPRQIWISAQQQLLAFGMSAEKIIPTFQAIQDAVAAAGGSGQTISEITTILAKIQSSGKVTAEELNELGARGIDAAGLIAQAMGTTAGQVREDITAQAISGVAFIDMLTGAMSERFAGAAAGVKQTWAGATDRIKGAVRDIGGLLASPLVDPMGGGAAVDWANSIADALRALESRLEPAMAALRDRAEPALDAFNDQLQKLAEWIGTADFGAIAEKIKPMLPAIMGVTAGLATMGAKSLPIIGNMVSGLKPLPVALVAAAMASPELRKALFDLLAAVAPLLQTAGQFSTMLASALGPALSVVAALLQPVVAVVGFLADRFGDLPAPIQMVVTALLALKGMQMAGMFTGLSTAFTGFRDQMDQQRNHAAMTGQSIGTMGAAYEAGASRVRTATVGIRGSLSSAAGFMAGPWGAAIFTGIGLLSMFGDTTDSAITDQQGLAEALEAGTGAITDQTREWVLNKLTTTGVGDIYRNMGGDLNDLVDAYLGVPGAMDTVNTAFAGYGRAVQEGTNKTSLSADEMRKLRDFLNSAAPAMDSARAAAQAKANADRDGANAAGDAAAANAGLAGAMYGVGDAADSVATRTQQLSQLLSGLFEAQFASQQAADGFQSGLHKLKGAFASNDKAATKSAAAGDKYGDSLKRQQKIIKDTRKQLEDLAEAQKKAEEEAAEAARNARQRALDELFGQQFDVQSTTDAFKAALGQAQKDISEGQSKAGALSLAGFSEGALANRERLRGIVQAAQAAIQAERNQGAGAERIGQLSRGLAGELAQSATAWGLNTDEVKQYTDAIIGFGNLALQPITVDLSGVTKEFAEQRAEIAENSAEQLENARTSAQSASASYGAAAAATVHTATLKGNSESAIENRDLMRGMVKAAQDEMTQLHLSGATKEELTRRGEELATQLEAESIALGFTKEDVALYTETIRVSAEEIGRYPVLTARADVAGAMTTVANFVRGVNEQMAAIEKNISIGVRTGMEYVNSMGGGHMFYAEGGFVSGPGGPREDKVRAMLSAGEFVVNAKDTARARPLLEAINNGKGMPGFADGGYVDPILLNYFGHPSTGMRETYDAMMKQLAPLAALTSGPLGWAASQAGKPYIWGGVGPAGYDCSGFMSAITNVIQGKGPHARRFATGGFPTGDFDRGPGNFMIGSRKGNPGHMAGTLLGVNVESRGSDGVVLGKKARGASDSLFGGNIWHLKGYADGGLVSGDPPFDLLSPLGMHFEKVLGSYARGTDHVPMDGLYELHRGEAVVPASQNASSGTWVLEVRGDGSKASDFVIDSINKGVGTGQIRLVKK